MSLSFVLAACAFAVVLAALVACIDWWREVRLMVARPAARAPVPVVRVSSVPAARKRAA